MSNAFPPALIFIVGALLIPLFKGRLRSVYLVALPILGFINLVNIPLGTHWTANFLDFQLVFGEVDRLSRIFGIIFHIISFIAIIFVLNFKNKVEYVAGFIYAGSALGAVFAGDLISFFVFWEMLTVSSVFLVLANKTKKSMEAGFRYVLIHVVGGLILLAGIIMYIHETGSLKFEEMGLSSVATYLIFIGFGINCAWPILHTWLVDAYPEATIGGVIFLSAFTTKTAVYALARGFPGTEPLIWIGTAMAAFPIFFAVIENDLRRVLAYSLINQVGFMVVGIGIGNELAMNGAVAHAFNDILFKALLFMSVGAVMFRTGKVNATDLGGLYKSMPWTCLFCIVGAASISAFPLFSGFVSKSMVMTAAGDEHFFWVWFLLLFASAGVFHHAGIKIPFFTFFSHDAGHRVKEAPTNMLIAMGIAAFLCIFIGSFPKYLYSILPYPVAYEPYTYEHIIGQSQLLFFSAMAFTLLLLSGIYPAEMRAINLDADWIYRKGSRVFYRIVDVGLNGINDLAHNFFVGGITQKLIDFGKDAPARIVYAFTLPFLNLKGMSNEEKMQIKEKMFEYSSQGKIPIGIGVGLAVLLLSGLYFL